MDASNIVVDCDSHVMEPPDLWERYLEPKYRERAIRIVRDPADGMEVLMSDNQPILRGVLGALGGANLDRRRLLVACNSDIGISFMYHEACLKGSYA